MGTFASRTSVASSSMPTCENGRRSSGISSTTCRCSTSSRTWPGRPDDLSRGRRSSKPSPPASAAIRPRISSRPWCTGAATWNWSGTTANRNCSRSGRPPSDSSVASCGPNDGPTTFPVLNSLSDGTDAQSVKVLRDHPLPRGCGRGGERARCLAYAPCRQSSWQGPANVSEGISDSARSRRSPRPRGPLARRLFLRILRLVDHIDPGGACLVHVLRIQRARPRYPPRRLPRNDRRSPRPVRPRRGAVPILSGGDEHREPLVTWEFERRHHRCRPTRVGQILLGGRSRNLVRAGPAGGPLQSPSLGNRSDDLYRRHGLTRSRSRGRRPRNPEAQEICDRSRDPHSARCAFFSGLDKRGSARSPAASHRTVAAVRHRTSLPDDARTPSSGGGAKELPEERMHLHHLFPAYRFVHLNHDADGE